MTQSNYTHPHEYIHAYVYGSTSYCLPLVPGQTRYYPIRWSEIISPPQNYMRIKRTLSVTLSMDFIRHRSLHFFFLVVNKLPTSSVKTITLRQTFFLSDTGRKSLPFCKRRNPSLILSCFSGLDMLCYFEPIFTLVTSDG